jgi:HAAS domain-containing protein
MTISSDLQQQIEAYLQRLRKGLRNLRDEDAREIVEELRSHIVEKAAAGGEMTSAGVESALAALGTPEELAGQYVTDDLLARAESSRAPWAILRGIFHWATLSVKGFLVLMVCTVGYMFGGACLIAALAKPFNPRVGLWMLDKNTYSLALGMTSARMQGHELLGWLLIPICLSLGGGTILLTTHFGLSSIRKFREARRRLGLAGGPK